MVAMMAEAEAMIFVCESDETVGQCDDEDMRKLEALAANKQQQGWPLITLKIYRVGVYSVP
jgi:hypothetical protein